MSKQKNQVMKWKDKDILLEYAHLNIPGIANYVNNHSPTYDGFYVGEEERPSILLDVMLNPDYFYFVCRQFLNIELLPMQCAVLQELWIRPFPMLVGSRGLGKSFILALYCLLRCLLCPGSKIVIVGAAFRQSKVIFDYMVTIWKNAPLLQGLAGDEKKAGPRVAIDRCTFTIGDSWTLAVPLGDGSKIRGLRAHYIIADEFASIPAHIYENVVAGFAAVSANPVDNVKMMARKKIKQERDVWTEKEQEVFDNRMGNQAVLSGTAYYDFNHFAQYWKRYKAIINSKGDRGKLEEIFNGEVPESFSWRDYSIMRIPYTKLPLGFMDDKHVARSKATVHNGIYLMEFGACLKRGTKIVTDKGLVNIEDLKVDDLVLTHKCRFRKVQRVTCRHYNNLLVKFYIDGLSQQLSLTPEHPVWQGDNTFISAACVTKNLYFPKLDGTQPLKINKKELEEYDDFVFNLEVEEDHSYCTTLGAVHNCFATDSNGFFKRSLIESCVCKSDNPINMPSCGPVNFSASLTGDRDKRYVYAVDPASEHDNFSIVVLELHPDHRRIVYCWTTTKNKHRERMKKNSEIEQDFYAFCARKIRDLMKVFPCERIALDSQGGGYAIEEALHDPDKLKEGELPLWQIIEDDKEKPSDGQPGLHIIELISFAKAEWTVHANFGLRKDFEDKVLLFPFFDPISISEAINEDSKLNRLYDTLEDCVMEIEDLKDELATIVHTQTDSTGRDRWDTPEIKKEGGKKGRQRKDRYSSLLMANMVARTIQRTLATPNNYVAGGFAHDIAAVSKEKKDKHAGQLCNAPEWFSEYAKKAYRR